MNTVPVSQGCVKGLQDQGSNAFTTSVSVGAFIPRKTPSFGADGPIAVSSSIDSEAPAGWSRSLPDCRCRYEGILAKQRARGSYNGDVALSRAYALAGLVNGDHAGRAAGIDGHAGPLQIVEMRNAIGNHGGSCAGQKSVREHLCIFGLYFVVVFVERARIDGCVGTSELCKRYAGYEKSVLSNSTLMGAC